VGQYSIGADSLVKARLYRNKSIGNSQPNQVPTPSSAIEQPNHIQTTGYRRRLSAVITIIQKFPHHASRFLENVVV
jgi:hypothetical protein